MTYTASIHVDAPVAAVFDFFRDPANWQRQGTGNPGVVFKDVRLTPEGVGTHYRWVARVAGLPVEGFNVFTEFVPNERITDRSSLALEGTWTYRVEREGSGTRLTLENQVGSLWRLPPLQKLLDLVTARTHGPLLTRLKARIEGSDAAA